MPVRSASTADASGYTSRTADSRTPASDAMRSRSAGLRIPERCRTLGAP